jgi:hypothetical protein
MAKKHIIINTEEIQQYLKDLKKIPVITHQRQDEIFEQLIKKELPKEELDAMNKQWYP